MQSEDKLVEWLRRRFPPGRGVRTGIGDDAAVLAADPGQDWVVTTDLLVEGVHFLKGSHAAQAVGWKALAHSLSDLAAMGARPRYALVALAVPPRTPDRWVKNFFDGLGRLARRHQVQIAGGDLSSAPLVFADVQVLGTVEKGRAALRRGARPGDVLFVSGALGYSALGLFCLRARVASTRNLIKRALRAHFYPEPRVALGRALGRRGLTSLMDISDGLSTDLARLCRTSGVGTRVEAERIPAVELPAPLARRLRTSGLELALHGGEDYELLFTVPEKAAARWAKKLAGVPLTRIGTITRNRELLLIGASGRAQRLEPRGWDHFQGRD